MKDVLDEEDIVGTVFVRADITCGSIIELPYYSAKYKDVCIECGNSNNLDINEASYPMCSVCKEKGVKARKRRSRSFKPKE